MPRVAVLCRLRQTRGLANPVQRPALFRPEGVDEHEDERSLGARVRAEPYRAPARIYVGLAVFQQLRHS